ncbi:MAG TPA: tetratricopeptide repeat protein [Vicinamibacterales bacterium]|jgi:TolA-binding protein|nr:tetratricopeptide repeat protein [Vicinamibacterales bacterium]
MKRIERHKLKGNEFADTVAKAREVLAERQTTVTWSVIAIVAVVVVLGIFVAWRTSRKNHATESLAQALAVAEAPVVTPPAPAPGSPAPVQQPGTFRTEQARAEAALPLLIKTADSYPSTDAGITARFRAASTLSDLGRYQEAEQRYREVIAKAGNSSIYSRTAKLGLADVLAAEGKYDEAISTLKELTTDPNSQLPLDGVLMQLARTATQGGKTDEATRAYNRIINEFPQSLYVQEAKQKIAEMKKA